MLSCSGHWTNLVYHNTHPLTSAMDILSPNLSPGVLFIPWPDLKLVSIQTSLIVALLCEGCILRCCLSGALQFQIPSYCVSNAVISNHDLLMGFPVTINIKHSAIYSFCAHFLDSVLVHLHSSWNLCPGGNLQIWEYCISWAIFTTTQGGCGSIWYLSTAQVHQDARIYYQCWFCSLFTGRVMLQMSNAVCLCTHWNCPLLKPSLNVTR